MFFPTFNCTFFNLKPSYLASELMNRVGYINDDLLRFSTYFNIAKIALADVSVLVFIITDLIFLPDPQILL